MNKTVENTAFRRYITLVRFITGKKFKRECSLACHNENSN